MPDVNSVRLLSTSALMMFNFASRRSLKIMLKWCVNLQVSDTVICSGPLPAYRGDEIHSRLSSLNGWMSKWCPQNNIGFIDNWTSFWGRPDMLKRDGLHPSWGGAALLSRNMAHSLRVRTCLTGARVRKQTDWLNQPSASRLTSQKSVNSQHIETLSPRYHTIETVSVPRTRKCRKRPNQSKSNNLIDVQQMSVTDIIQINKW